MSAVDPNDRGGHDTIYPRSGQQRELVRRLEMPVVIPTLHGDFMLPDRPEREARKDADRRRQELLRDYVPAEDADPEKKGSPMIVMESTLMTIVNEIHSMKHQLRELDSWISKHEELHSRTVWQCSEPQQLQHQHAQENGSTGVVSSVGACVPYQSPLYEEADGAHCDEQTSLMSSPRCSSQSSVELAPNDKLPTICVRNRHSVHNAIQLEPVVEMANAHNVRESMWDCGILIGLTPIGTGGSILLAALFVMNLLVQISLISVIGITFLHQRYLPSVGDVQMWRETVAHDWNEMDVMRKVSLVRRVCTNDGSLDTSEPQRFLLSQIRQYLSSVGPFRAGPLLCGLVLFYWFLNVTHETRDTISFAYGLANIPRGSETTLLTSPNKKMKLAAVSETRWVFLVVIICLRFMVSGLILCIGSLWLAMTKDIESMVTNTVALSIILDLDELLYGASAPLKVKAIMRVLEPFPKAVGSQWKGTGVQSLTSILASCLFVALLIQTVVAPQVQCMLNIESAMCGGYQDFVFGAQDATGEVMIADTLPLSEVDPDLSAQSWRRKSIHDVINARSPREVQSVWYMHSFSLFRASVSESMFEFDGDVTSCSDTPGNRWPPFAKVVLRSSTANPNASSCADLRNYCSAYQERTVRFMCPVTCGCRSPRSGLYLNSDNAGCPREVCQASPQFRRSLARIPCRDPTPQELRDMPGWNQFWRQYLDYSSEMVPDQTRHFKNISDSLLRDGCKGLAYAATTHDVFGGDFCAEALGLASVRAFCPVTCGCSRPPYTATCPSSCSAPKGRRLGN